MRPRHLHRPTVEGIEKRLMLSANPVLVADINPGPDASNPAEFTELGTVTYFVADSPGYGRELFRISDGQSALLADIRPGADGSEPKTLTEMGGQIYFSASRSNNEGTELWKSEGSADGTVLVKDINPATRHCGGILCPIVDLTTTGSKPRRFVVSQDRFYFLASEPSEPGIELWQSDGSAAGTLRLTEGLHGFEDIVVMGDYVVFKAHDGTGWEYRSFHAPSDSLRLITDVANSFGPGPITANATHAYFRVEQRVPTGINIVLQKTDGTPDGTQPFYDGTVLNPLHATDAGQVYLMAWKSGSGYELARINSEGDLTYIADGISASSTWADLNGWLYFEGRSSETGDELWKVRESGQAVLVADIASDGMSSAPRDFQAVGDQLYFTADDGIHGRELWKTDGTSEGTQLVADIHPGPDGSHPTDLVFAGDSLYFSADDGEHGREPWMLQVRAQALLGDINGDGEVGFADFIILSTGFGSTDATFAEGDLNDDGNVDFEDFIVLSANYGATSRSK